MRQRETVRETERGREQKRDRERNRKMDREIEREENQRVELEEMETERHFHKENKISVCPEKATKLNVKKVKYDKQTESQVHSTPPHPNLYHFTLVQDILR